MKKTTTISSELEEHREGNIIITEELFYKMTQQSHRIAVLEKALELACEDVGIVKVITKVLTDDKTTATVDDVAEYYINQAEKELEEENK